MSTDSVGTLSTRTGLSDRRLASATGPKAIRASVPAQPGVEATSAQTRGLLSMSSTRPYRAAPGSPQRASRSHVPSVKAMPLPAPARTEVTCGCRLRRAAAAGSPVRHVSMELPTVGGRIRPLELQLHGVGLAGAGADLQVQDRDQKRPIGAVDQQGT